MDDAPPVFVFASVAYSPTHPPTTTGTPPPRRRVDAGARAGEVQARMGLLLAPDDEPQHDGHGAVTVIYRELVHIDSV